jgi:hypothetical protein
MQTAMSKWTRTCQECLNEQETTFPPTENPGKMDRWLEMKCKKCKSPALDYGSEESETGDEDEGWLGDDEEIDNGKWDDERGDYAEPDTES